MTVLPSRPTPTNRRLRRLKRLRRRQMESLARPEHFDEERREGVIAFIDRLATDGQRGDRKCRGRRRPHSVRCRRLFLVAPEWLANAARREKQRGKSERQAGTDLSRPGQERAPSGLARRSPPKAGRRRTKPAPA